MIDELIEAAKAVRRLAHAPYSGFRVGAAIRDERGMVHVGCNVENVAFPDSLCAESGAISAMIAGGGTRIDAIAVVGGKGEAYLSCMPCGSCRQRIQEFATSGTRVLSLDPAGNVRSFGIRELLPRSYESNAT